MDETNWYLATSRGQEGPMAASALRARVAAGELPPDTLIWHESFGAQWRALRDTPFAADLPSARPAPAPYAAAAAAVDEVPPTLPPATAPRPANTYAVQPTPAPERGQLRVAAFVFALVIASLIGGIWAMAMAGRAPSVANAVGFTLLPAILLGFVVATITARGAGANPKAIAFFVVWMVMIGGNRLGQARLEERNNADAAISSVRSEVTRLGEALQENSETLTPIKPIDTRSTATGDFAIYEQFLKGVLNRNIALQNAYMAELDGIGWTTVLDPKRLDKDRDLVDSRRMVEQARAIAKRYEQRSFAALTETQAEIMKLDLPEASRREALAGFNRTKDKGRQRIETMWRLEQETLTTIADLVEVFGSGGQWEYVDEQILFERDEDIEQYNSLLAHVDELAKQQQALVQAGLGDAQQALDKISPAR